MIHSYWVLTLHKMCWINFTAKLVFSFKTWNIEWIRYHFIRLRWLGGGSLKIKCRNFVIINVESSVLMLTRWVQTESVSPRENCLENFNNKFLSNLFKFTYFRQVKPSLNIWLLVTEESISEFPSKIDIFYSNNLHAGNTTSEIL